MSDQQESNFGGVSIPDSKMVRDLTQFIRDTESELLFHHSTRVYLFGVLTGQRKGLKFDPELLYVGAMFHDIGLTEGYRRSRNRFEVDGANAAREFLKGYGVSETSVDLVWDAIALHTTPGIPEHKKPEVALVTPSDRSDAGSGGVQHDISANGRAVLGEHHSDPPTSGAVAATGDGQHIAWFSAWA